LRSIERKRARVTRK